jgi:hypothetical protein
MNGNTATTRDNIQQHPTTPDNTWQWGIDVSEYQQQHAWMRQVSWQQ